MPNKYIPPKRTEVLLSEGLMAQQWYVFFEQVGRIPLYTAVVNTHAKKAKYRASDYTEGTLFRESDTELTYAAIGLEWIYVFGTISGTLSPDQRPAGLDANDTGLKFFSTDYLREFVWDGAAWTEPDYRRDPHRYDFFDEDPGAGWHLADGTSVTRSRTDGTTESHTALDLRGRYIKGGTSAALHSAVAPGLSGRTQAVSSGTPTGTVSVSGSIGGASAAINVQSGSGASVATGTHTHSFSGSGSFTGDALSTHDHGVGSMAVDNTGEPSNAVLLPYYRL